MGIGNAERKNVDATDATDAMDAMDATDATDAMADTTEGGKKDKHPCAPENAARFLKWVRERGGVSVWLSANLSNPGASWSTPACNEDGSPSGKPSWESAGTPCRTITDPSEVEVVTAKEVKRFHVAVRRGSQGLSFKLTDASSRKLRDAVSRAGEEAWYQFDYSSQEAVIFVPGEKISLLEWEARQHGEEAVSQSDG